MKIGNRALRVLAFAACIGFLLFAVVRIVVGSGMLTKSWA